VMSYVTNAFASEGTRYVVAQIDRDFYVFADTGEEGGTYDQVVRFAESNLDRISMDSIIVI